MCLDVADVANGVVFGKQLRRRADVRGPLVELGTDVQQRDTRRRDIGDGLGQGSPHVRELVQLRRPGLEVGAEVKQPHRLA